MSLASVLSFLELEKKTGVVLVVASGTGRLYIREGRPVAVEIEPSVPDAGPVEQVLGLLSWDGGQFEFADQDVSGSDEIGMSIQALLLEHARISDESERKPPR